MDEGSNPYEPGAGTMPPELVGRGQMIAAFRASLRRASAGHPGKSQMPTGLRGVGKTVLLLEFLRIAALEGCVTASVEASDGESMLRTLIPALRKIAIGFNTGEAVKEVARKLMRVLKSISITFPNGFRIDAQPEHGTADSGNLAHDLTDVFVSVGEAAAAEQTVVVVTIDEAQYISKDELVALLAALHQTGQRRLPLIAVATGLPQLLAIAGDAKSYAERLFDFPQVGALTAAETAEAVRGPAEKLGVTFDVEALEAIYEATRGYPYFVQLWAQRSWDHANFSPITVSDILAVRPSVIDRLDRGFFSVRFERLTPEERRYLRAMAELGTGPYEIESVRRSLRLTQDDARAIESELIEKGMVYSTQQGVINYTVPLFDSFIKRTVKLDA